MKTSIGNSSIWYSFIFLLSHCDSISGDDGKLYLRLLCTISAYPSKMFHSFSKWGQPRNQKSIKFHKVTNKLQSLNLVVIILMIVCMFISLTRIVQGLKTEVSRSYCIVVWSVWYILEKLLSMNISTTLNPYLNFCVHPTSQLRVTFVSISSHCSALSLETRRMYFVYFLKKTMWRAKKWWCRISHIAHIIIRIHAVFTYGA